MRRTLSLDSGPRRGSESGPRDERGWVVQTGGTYLLLWGRGGLGKCPEQALTFPLLLLALLVGQMLCDLCGAKGRPCRLWEQIVYGHISAQCLIQPQHVLPLGKAFLPLTRESQREKNWAPLVQTLPAGWCLGCGVGTSAGGGGGGAPWLPVEPRPWG